MLLGPGAEGSPGSWQTVFVGRRGAPGPLPTWPGQLLRGLLGFGNWGGCEVSEACFWAPASLSDAERVSRLSLSGVRDGRCAVPGWPPPGLCAQPCLLGLDHTELQPPRAGVRSPGLLSMALPLGTHVGPDWSWGGWSPALLPSAHSGRSGLPVVCSSLSCSQIAPRTVADSGSELSPGPLPHVDSAACL